MGKTAKSQWDFGELFPLEATRKVLSVSDLTGQIRRLLEKQVGLVWVGGEITNLRLQSSGHAYFTLKDAVSQLSCVLFRGEAQVDRLLLQDGRHVALQGEVTVYEPRGQYQLRVVAVELQGEGALQAAFERLKQKLNLEGLFAKERKRPLPKYPRRIGLVTSPTGAAIRDVLHAIERRNPSLEIVLAPCRVQGEGAAQEIAAGVRLLNEFNERLRSFAGQPEELRPAVFLGAPLDLLLVTRGGGSLEDLWAFNEEVVARAIFESALPVVSGVGHEIDFTISDFVADVRAATPTAAAEIITEGVFSSYQFLTQVGQRISQLARQQLADKEFVLESISRRLIRVHPRRQLNDWLQRLDDLQVSMLRCVKVGTRRQSDRWRDVSERLLRARPALVIKQRRERFRQVDRRFRELARHQVEVQGNRLATLEARLRLLSPKHVLARGYSITSDAATGRIVREAGETRSGQRLNTRLKSGEVFSRIEE